MSEEREEYVERIIKMREFLQNLIDNEGGVLAIEDPVELGEDLAKMGIYLLKGVIDKKTFLRIMGEIWDEAPQISSTLDEGEVIFEAD